MSTTRPAKVPLLSMLVERWAEVVAEVARGYTLTFDDYLNDIDLRHMIAHALRNAPAEQIVAMAPLLHKMDSLDAQFRELTESVNECIWGEANERDEHWSPDNQWYYYRQPLNHPTDW